MTDHGGGNREGLGRHHHMRHTDDPNVCLRGVQQQTIGKRGCDGDGTEGLVALNLQRFHVFVDAKRHRRDLFLLRVDHLNTRRLGNDDGGVTNGGVEGMRVIGDRDGILRPLRGLQGRSRDGAVGSEC